MTDRKKMNVNIKEWKNEVKNNERVNERMKDKSMKVKMREWKNE